MNKIGVILQKEWLELRQERTLILTTLLVPALFTAMPIGMMLILRNTKDDDIMELQAFIQAGGLSGMSVEEIGQVVLGQVFAMLFLIIPMMLPSTIAAYSIVGEKTRRTLEPLLAAPITITDLLTGKTLAALIPSLLMTWLWGLVFIAGMRLLTTSQEVFERIITPGWLILWLACAPVLALICVILTVAISSRATDPRSAQQSASVVILPLMLLLMGQLFGLQVLSPAFAIGATVIVTLIAVTALWFAIRFFRRDTILKRWT